MILITLIHTENKLKDKILVTFGTYNSPWFLDTLLESIDHHDAGYPYDLLILDHSSTDKRQLQILDKYSKFYRVETRQNLGRAQGAYNHAYQSNKDYKYYFFLHDDSYILRDNWLRLAVDRINDDSVEDVCTGPGFENFEELPVGKVGFQGYEWQGIRQYLRTNHRTVFYYMSDIAKNLSVEIPLFYQHINDDKILYKNELLNKMERIYNIEHFRQMQDSKEFEFIDNYFESNFPNRTPFKPNEIYGSHYHGFQTTSEFLVHFILSFE